MTMNLLFAPLLLATAAVQEVPLGKMVEGLQCHTDPSQTYTLYLPSSYTPERHWPAMLIFDPRGRSRFAAELFLDAAEEYGWILLSSDNTRSDGPWEPNVVAIRALWPEVNTRFATDQRRIYAAGFSGGAHLAWTVGNTPGTFAGVIASGGRVLTEGLPDKPTFASFAAAGDIDFNYQGTRQMDAHFASLGAPHRVEIFAGVHRWMPPAMARQAIEWMELQAMRQGLREGDPELVARLLTADVAAAQALEASGDLAAAMRRHDSVARTFEGLAQVDTERARARGLAENEAVKRALADERHWDDFEATMVARLWEISARLDNPDVPMPAVRITRELDIATLKRMAAEESYSGTTARRVLEAIYVRMGYYLTRDYMAAREYRKLVTVLDVASAIKEDSPEVAYNLACAHALLGKKKPALAALERAIELGYTNADHMRSDPDLESLREDERFQSLLTRLSPSALDQP